MESVFVVIAAYNEEKHIRQVVEGSKKYCRNIVVVNDGSKDRTAEEAEKAGATVLTHVINLGKGAAVKTGCNYALKKGAKMMVLIDGDGQHEPKEITNFVNALKEGNDIIFSYREERTSMPIIKKIGNDMIRLATSILYGIHLKDTQCGLRALTSGAYKKVKWRSSNYAMESEMIANAGKHKLKYKEMPIATIYSDKYRGTTVIDGMKIVFNMLFWRLTR